MNKQSQNLLELKRRTNFAGHQERCWHQPLDGEHLNLSCAELRDCPTLCLAHLMWAEMSNPSEELKCSENGGKPVKP